MNIAAALRDIGRGREGARAMSPEVAFEVFAAILQGRVGDLELGAFCAAMRIKGETPEEMAAFLRATAHVQRQCGVTVQVPSPGAEPSGPTSPPPVPVPVVLPSYNGSRRLPLLTPLLALMLAQGGVPVLVHGMATEDRRVHAFDIFERLGITPHRPSTAGMAGTSATLAPGQVTLLHTRDILPGLADLLDVRRTIGLRNSGHSLVKLMNPCAGRAVVVGSYTHPEYAVSMAEVFSRVQADALLLRGTEGEPVADPRRMPAIDAFIAGGQHRIQAPQEGSLRDVPHLPDADADATARWTLAVLQGQAAAPEALLQQLQHLLNWQSRVQADAAATPVETVR